MAYVVHIEVTVPDRSNRYNYYNNLSGMVIVNDGYRQSIPGYREFG